VTGRDVILVDFSYKYPVILKMAEDAHSILILDHHKTAQEDLAGFVGAACNFKQSVDLARSLLELSNTPPVSVVFDMARSGAGITWDFFFPYHPRPALINHIEDRDLWLFKLEGTREIQANVFSWPYDFEVWDRLMAADTASLRAEGAAIERKHFKDIEELLRVTTRRMKIGGHIVPAANLPYTFSSDAAGKLAEGQPFAACYMDTPEGRVFSLRSRPEGLDVSEIAKQYGGGGHKNAAGFKVAYERLAEFLP
jgi:oligoribonuclease NrnB/cAMP/cGMP phosphodiesterase (DHH superfamily)